MSSLRIRYQTIEFGESDIHVRTLRDRQQFSDAEGAAEKLGISSASWSLFGVIWPAGMVLANLMYEHEIAGKRILEVGCGIALASLVLNHRHANITATDYHPEAKSFLSENVRLNAGDAIPFVRAGWEDVETGLGLFDLVIGSDLLYEQGHVELLSGFIDRHAKLRSEVVLTDPGRGHHARFSRKMVSMGFSHSQHRPAAMANMAQSFPGQVLCYQR